MSNACVLEMIVHKNWTDNQKKNDIIFAYIRIYNNTVCCNVLVFFYALRTIVDKPHIYEAASCVVIVCAPCYLYVIRSIYIVITLELGI